MTRRIVIATAFVALVGANAGSQATPPARATRQGAAARLGQPPVGRARAGVAAQPANRQMLEQRVRQALARVTRQRLALNDTQMTQLARVDMRFERQRRALLQEQRQTRIALRAAMQDSAGVDQARVGQQMDKLLELERRRIDLLEAEQKDLATFLTPLQRAKYQALQENVRARLEDSMRPAPLPGDSTAVGPPVGQRGAPRRRPLIRPPQI